MAVASDIDRHYGGADISARILHALAAAGRDIDCLTRADLVGFDEFHGGGIASTRDLAHAAGLTAGLKVLDVGCGIGGPARTLAAEFGCQVTGVDLTAEFVRAAQMLTARLGMAAVCHFIEASATALLFPDHSFDVVWSQNMLMNVADKPAFFAEVARVLQPGGRFAFEAVLTGDGRAIHQPTFWAATPAINFLVTRSVLEQGLRKAGLRPVAATDTTAQVMANGRLRKAAIEAHDPTQLSIDVIVADDVEIKINNMLKNNEEGRTVTLKAVYRRDP